MPALTATGIACANIAFIKYWGNRDNSLRIPVNGSISMNLDGLYARTTVTFNPALPADTFTLNNSLQSGAALERVSRFLSRVRALADTSWFANVISENNFPTGAGIASSAAAFAALSLAASHAAGLDLSETDLSRLARRGSGSACRSIPGGFVEWLPGNSDETSYAVSIAPPDHWALVDCVAVLQAAHKPVGSSEGHTLAFTSPLQTARVASAPLRLDACRRAILQRDFDALAAVVELDSSLMHAVMMTSNPPLFYWEPASLEIMKTLPRWRAAGVPACYTLDAGANVHVITLRDYSQWITDHLLQISGVQQVLTAGVAGPARLTTPD